MIDFLVITLLMAMVILLLVIALLVADNNRITREHKAAALDAAWCRAIVDAFVGKVEKERGK